MEDFGVTINISNQEMKLENIYEILKKIMTKILCLMLGLQDLE